MAKHKINKTKQDLLGQYMTTNADKLLKNFKHVVQDKIVVDPCAGHGDLLSWAWKNGAIDCEGYDIDPKNKETILNDMYENPIDCSGKVVVTNPPYLHSSRCSADEKWIFKKWGLNDLYKCYLATLYESNVEEAIIIQPSNFLFESHSKARENLFFHYDIKYAEYWDEPTFDGVVISIMVMHIKKRSDIFYNTVQNFKILNRTTNKETEVNLLPQYKYLNGEEYFDYINVKPIGFQKAEEGKYPINTNIGVCLLAGKKRMGLHIHDGDPYYTTSQTKWLLHSPVEIKDEQAFVDRVNATLDHYFEKYDGMFIANFIQAGTKILPKAQLVKIMTKELQNL